MTFFHHTQRLLHIAFIALKHGLDQWLPKTKTWRVFHIVIRLSLIHHFYPLQQSRGVRIRTALEELGPIFVKFGQVLSTRVDIFPEDIIQELSKLQDRVPPFPGVIAQKMIEEALHAPLSQHYTEFDLTPLASASVAQVHTAKLLDGQAVVVKVLRPNIHHLVQRDIRLFKQLAKLMHRFWKKSRRFKPLEIVAQFNTVLSHELDLVREAANASTLKRHFEQSPLLYIPTIHWPLTRQNILTMEQLYGISITNRALLDEKGFNRKLLAERLMELFFIQAFRDCFFHADIHPGNLLVSERDPNNPQYIALDFGIVGTLSPSDQYYLAQNMMAFLNRDYRQVALLHMKSGWIDQHISIEEFTAAIRTISEPMFERPFNEISFGELLLRLFRIASDYHINIQPQLLLLQKTLVNIEGISRQLDPNIDLFNIAKPFFQRWIREQTGMTNIYRQLKSQFPNWAEKLPQLPELLHSALSVSVEKSKLPVHNIAHTKTSVKDLCIGLLLGLCFSLMWIIVQD